MDKKLLFSITRKDFDIQYFRGSGKGGQKKQKTSSACRIVHRASGAVGTSQDDRSQSKNTKIAFNRLVESEKFKNWLRLEASSKIMGFSDISELIESMVEEHNLKVEVQDEDGNWVLLNSKGEEK